MESVDEIDDDVMVMVPDDSRATPYPSTLLRNYARGIIPDYMNKRTSTLKRKADDTRDGKRAGVTEPRLFQFISVFPGTVIGISKDDGVADDSDILDGAHPLRNDILCVMPKTIPPIVMAIQTLHTRDIFFLGVDYMVDPQQNATTAISTIQCRDISTWSAFDIMQYTKFTTVSSSYSATGLRLESGNTSPVDQICLHINTLTSSVIRSVVLCVMVADTGYSHLVRKIIAACHYIFSRATGDDAVLFDYGVEAGIKSVRTHVGASSDAVENETQGGVAPDRHSHDLGEAIYNSLTRHTDNPLQDASGKSSHEVQKIVAALSAMCSRERTVYVCFSAHPVPAINSADMIHLTREMLI